jgi:ribulose-bisphosphate carboxylase large chain
VSPLPASDSRREERLRVSYLLSGDEDEAAARARARDICFEQTVEFPDDLVPAGFIRDEVIGRIESLTPAGAGRWSVTISYPVDATARELLQLLNVVFGNISIKPGIHVERMSLPPELLASFPGPRFGRAGLRSLVGVRHRPLICTALKPMGLSAAELGEQARQFALGGIDLIKDDHGLTDQRYAHFEERVARCSDAVAEANARTGRRCVYVPNVTGSFGNLLERAHLARRRGAGGLLVSPFLAGLDAMRVLAEDEGLALPILAHPAFGGSLVTSPTNGFSHAALYGQVMRLAGADATIYPNYGGRFAFTRQECASIAAATAEPMGALAPIFPAPGGGMTVERAPDMLEVYGREFVMLIGGGLHRRGPDLADNARFFVDMLESI